MEGGAVGHNFERYPPKDHPCQVWLNLVQVFQRRRFKCESLRRTTDRRRMPSDDKSSHGLWPGELKRLITPKWVMGFASFSDFNTAFRYLSNCSCFEYSLNIAHWTLKNNGGY